MSGNRHATEDIAQDYVGDELQVFALAKNWKRYWSKKLSPVITQPVLEVGAGIGSNLRLLNTSNCNWTALEPDKKQAQRITDICLQDPCLSKTQVINGILSDIPIENKYRTMIYLDVLEHIERDADEIALAAKYLEDGGKLIVLAPAHKILFSPFDRSVGHFRRYNKPMLKALTVDTLKVDQLYYLDSVGCVASLANSMILKSKMPTEKQILFWDRVLVPASTFLDKFLLHRIGKTVVMVWTKET